MAPTPGEDYEHKQFSQNIPSVVTSTYTPNPQQTVTVAYLVNSFPDYDNAGSMTTVTRTTFTDLAEASTAAEQLQEAHASQEQGIFPTDPAAYSSLFYPAAPSSAQAENYPSRTPTGYSTAAVTAYPSNPPQSQAAKKNDGPSVAALAIGIIVPILVCLILATVFIFWLSRYRKKARRTQAAGLAERMSSEMSQVGRSGPKPAVAATADERAYLAPPNGPLPPTAALTSTPTAAGALRQEPPVILSTTMNNTYYTGIDTSDHISLSDQRSMASHDTFGEEPPPPYRPRSVPPISRGTSVRTSMISTPNRNSSVRSRCETLSSGSMIRRSNEVRSPFDDPEDEEEEDTISEVSTIRGSTSRRETDRLSVVSDLSYQDEPTSSHSHV
jgi:hypothetical protein